MLKLLYYNTVFKVYVYTPNSSTLAYTPNHVNN